MSIASGPFRRQRRRDDLNCMPRFDTVAPEVPLPEQGLEGVLAGGTRNRQSAVTFLQTAANTQDAVERTRLRRQAAELILPHRVRRSETAD